MARPKTPEAVAHHEAGHAVVAHFQELKFKHVTIVPEKDSFGHMRHVSFPKWSDPSIESSARVRIRAEGHITVSHGTADKE